MRFLPFLLVALPLAAALPASTDNASLEARAAKSCTQSSQCGSVNNFCNRSKCDTRKSLGASCYKDIGCISNKCSSGKCVEGSALTNGERCETSKSCASSYCGNSKCQAPAANGASCYKAAGCQSGICTNQKCTAPATTPTPAPTPVDKTPTDDAGNVAKNNHFENDILAPWEKDGDVTVVKNATDAYDGKQYASLRATSQYGENSYPELYQSVPSGYSRRNSVSDKPEAKAYAVSVQYRVPEFIAGSKGVGCNLSFGFDNEYMEDTSKAFLPVNKKVADWTKFDTMIANNRTSIEYIGFGLICPEGAAVVQVDDVQFVPTAYPESDPTDVAQNGGFENGGTNGDPWKYQNGATLATNNAKYGGRYALVQSGQSISQDIVISSTAPKDSYNAYQVKFQYFVQSVSSGVSSATPCSLYLAENGGAPDASMDITATSATDTYASFSKVASANSSVSNIKIGVSCPSGQTARVYVDQVQFLTKLDD